MKRLEEKLSKNLDENSLREALCIGSQEYSHWQAEKVIFDLLVDRPVDRPTVIFLIGRVFKYVKIFFKSIIFENAYLLRAVG